MIEAIDETIGEGSVGAMSNRMATGWITSDPVRRVDAAVDTAVLEFDIFSPLSHDGLPGTRTARYDATWGDDFIHVTTTGQERI